MRRFLLDGAAVFYFVFLVVGAVGVFYAAAGVGAGVG
jgi:hypothetical protein